MGVCETTCLGSCWVPRLVTYKCKNIKEKKTRNLLFGVATYRLANIELIGSGMNKCIWGPQFFRALLHSRDDTHSLFPLLTETRRARRAISALTDIMGPLVRHTRDVSEQERSQGESTPIYIVLSTQGLTHTHNHQNKQPTHQLALPVITCLCSLVNSRVRADALSSGTAADASRQQRASADHAVHELGQNHRDRPGFLHCAQDHLGGAPHHPGRQATGYARARDRGGSLSLSALRG